METLINLVLAVIIVFGGMLFWDIITKLLSDEDPRAQSYWFSIFEEKFPYDGCTPPPKDESKEPHIK
jgi:hypothetical protein